MSTTPAAPIRLYTNPLSGHGHRVQLLLSMLELPHVVINVPLPEFKSAEHLRRNPFGQIPVIEDGDLTLFESNAILVYLATRYGDGRLLPRDAQQAAAVQQWLSFAAGPIYNGPNIARLCTQFGAPLDGEKARKTATAFFSVIEKLLAGRRFAIGDAPTIADVAAYAYVAVAPEGDVSLDPYPAIRAWLGRVEALPGFVPMHRGGLKTLAA
jgi:glutathione S-transferase